MKKTSAIVLNSLPILLMMALIPLVTDDYLLATLYALIIVISLLIKRERNDIVIFLFGFCIMILSESLFISTGVETFIRNSLFGLMPLWLPFLWGYSFIAIKRGIEIVNK